MKRWSFIILLFLMSCANKPADPAIEIGLIDSGRSLKITGLNYSVMQDVHRDSTNNWQNLMKIYPMPADTDMKDLQLAQPGKFMLKDSTLVFSPDTPFIKQRTYFLRYYNYNQTGDMWDFIKGKRKAGQTNHTDLIFKP